VHHVVWNSFEVRLELILIRIFSNLHRAACSLTVCHTAFQTMRCGGAARGCGYAASKGKVHMHSNNSPTRVRCNMYTLPGNTSMNSYMRRFACRPTPVYLPSKSYLESHPQFLWLGFPLCAFVAGHKTSVIRFLHKSSIMHLCTATTHAHVHL